MQLLLNICSLVVFVILHSLREAFNGLSSQDVCQVAGKDKTMTTFFFSLMSVYTVQSVHYKTRNCKTMSKLKRSIDNWSLEVLFTVIMTVFARRNFKSYTAFIYCVHDEKWHSTQYSVVPVILYANHSRRFTIPTHFRTKS